MNVNTFIVFLVMRNHHKKKRISNKLKTVKKYGKHKLDKKIHNK